MVEQGIYFMLGCIVTALAALMFAPVFWRRALRLTRKRLQLQVPLSMQEILAERDQLRAEFAVERLRIEQAAEKIRATKTSDMAEIGRRQIENAGLRVAMDELRTDAGATMHDLGLLKRELAETESENSALKLALDDAFAVVEEWRQRAAGAASEEGRLKDLLDSHRATVAGLETRAMGLEMRLTDSERAADARLKSSEQGLRSHLEAAIGQATRHETSAITLKRECEEARARVRALEAELSAASENRRATQLERSLRLDKARGAERFDHLATGDAQIAQDTTGATEPVEGSDADLRASIHALGLAVAMMSRRDQVDTQRPANVDAPTPVGAN